MRNTLLAGLLALALLPPMYMGITAPVHAQEVVCQDLFDDVVKQFADAGVDVALIPEDKLPEALAELELLTGEKYGNITRAFVVVAGDKILAGLEQNGCLLPPVFLGFVNARSLSGRTPYGTFA